jgi:hypothetical protein
MAITILSTPYDHQEHELNPANNFVPFVIDSNFKSRRNFKYIFDVFVNGLLVGQFKHSPDFETTFGVFDIGKVLQNYLNYHLNQDLTGVNACPNSAVSYFIQLGESFSRNNTVTLTSSNNNKLRLKTGSPHNLRIGDAISYNGKSTYVTNIDAADTFTTNDPYSNVPITEYLEGEQFIDNNFIAGGKIAFVIPTSRPTRIKIGDKVLVNQFRTPTVSVNPTNPQYDGEWTVTNIYTSSGNQFIVTDCPYITGSPLNPGFIMPIKNYELRNVKSTKQRTTFSIAYDGVFDLDELEYTKEIVGSVNDTSVSGSNITFNVSNTQNYIYKIGDKFRAELIGYNQATGVDNTGTVLKGTIGNVQAMGNNTYNIIFSSTAASTDFSEGVGTFIVYKQQRKVDDIVNNKFLTNSPRKLKIGSNEKHTLGFFSGKTLINVASQPIAVQVLYKNGTNTIYRYKNTSPNNNNNHIFTFGSGTWNLKQSNTAELIGSTAIPNFTNAKGYNVWIENTNQQRISEIISFELTDGCDYVEMELIVARISHRPEFLEIIVENDENLFRIGDYVRVELLDGNNIIYTNNVKVLFINRVVDDGITYWLLTLETSPVVGWDNGKVYKTNCWCTKPNRFESYRLMWKNRPGGVFDYFTFDLRSDETIEIKRFDYKRKVGGAKQDGTFGYKLSDRGNTSYHNEATRKVIVNSDWLTQNEIDWLSELYTSKEVYLLKDGNTYPITILNEDLTIGNKNNDGLVRYNIEFEYSEKIKLN